MALLPCKVVIDDGAAASGAAACLGPSVALFAAAGIEPSEEQSKAIKKGSEVFCDAVWATLRDLEERAAAQQSKKT